MNRREFITLLGGAAAVAAGGAGAGIGQAPTDRVSRSDYANSVRAQSKWFSPGPA